MVQKETKGIQISVRSLFLPKYSNPERFHFLFAYAISIENRSIDPIQVLRRHWYIFDSTGIKREVDGEGVVGEKPIILPGEIYAYESACDLHSEIGYMRGQYLVQNPNTKEQWTVDIPEFKLIVPEKLN